MNENERDTMHLLTCCKWVEKASNAKSISLLASRALTNPHA